jgi:septal ring factor EnvC (AmiA/AmiB activator)
MQQRSLAFECPETSAPLDAPAQTCLPVQAAEREVKRAAAEVEEYKKHIAALEKDLEAASASARALEQELRRQQTAIRDLDALRAELEATSKQCESWRSKHSCASSCTWMPEG